MTDETKLIFLRLQDENGEPALAQQEAMRVQQLAPSGEGSHFGVRVDLASIAPARYLLVVVGSGRKPTAEDMRFDLDMLDDLNEARVSAGDSPPDEVDANRAAAGQPPMARERGARE